MKQLPLPRPRPVLFPLRSADTATTTVQPLSRHRRRVTIDHQPLRGVTPEMVLWWFQNIGGTMSYGDAVVPNYLAWHPVDHIRWELARPAPGGGAREGARFRIIEAFQGRPEFYIDTTESVERLDATGIRLVRRLAGVPVLQLSHTWSAGEGHTHYVSVLEIGSNAALLTPVNRYLTERRFPMSMTRAWLVHNIEEVGVLEHILPGAYAVRADADARPTGAVDPGAHSVVGS
ncbi:hypothetical protein [uncultured Nocardioides sp.]|uniref:DAPG hydrolase PhiG domain-containing protein n=1 Tax=uncultured Nocardioides sp. TaxID=198441 RepID=A0A6J4N2V3_9ACTN|nr:hypothetical protein [uncultured Nocardioides sp.]CAA9374861.1 MAG: hypothetical protein AVDCRST_MAG06-387 [uncultured Nocardioides sp.]